MADTGKNELLSKEELEAAIAEIEALGPEKDGVPDLQAEDKPDKIVPIPVPGLKPGAAPPAGIPRESNPAPAAAPSAAAPPTAAPRAESSVSDRPSSFLPDEPGSEESPPARTTAPPSRRPRRFSALVRLPSLLYQAADLTLSALNRPTAWLPGSIRSLLGLIGLVTIVVSLIAAFGLPLLFPPHDPVATLRKQSRNVQAGVHIEQPAPPAPTAEP